MPPAEERAYRAGAGQTSIDSDDEDMVDAALLAMPDAAGGIFWKPSTLQDIYDIPARTLALFFAYRSGQAKALAKARGSGKQGTIGGKKVG